MGHPSLYRCAGTPTVRVMNGNSSCQGRVEVLYKDIWGTVCDDDWDMLNAKVVCRELGCGQAIAFKGQAYFGYGSGPILLDNVDCVGSERQLSDCRHLGWGQQNCGHHEDVGVICARKSRLQLSIPVWGHSGSHQTGFQDRAQGSPGKTSALQRDILRHQLH